MNRVEKRPKVEVFTSTLLLFGVMSFWIIDSASASNDFAFYFFPIFILSFLFLVVLVPIMFYRETLEGRDVTTWTGLGFFTLACIALLLQIIFAEYRQVIVSAIQFFNDTFSYLCTVGAVLSLALDLCIKRKTVESEKYKLRRWSTLVKLMIVIIALYWILGNMFVPPDPTVIYLQPF